MALPTPTLYRDDTVELPDFRIYWDSFLELDADVRAVLYSSFDGENWDFAGSNPPDGPYEYEQTLPSEFPYELHYRIRYEDLSEGFPPVEVSEYSNVVSIVEGDPENPVVLPDDVVEKFHLVGIRDGALSVVAPETFELEVGDTLFHKNLYWQVDEVDRVWPNSLMGNQRLKILTCSRVE